MNVLVRTPRSEKTTRRRAGAFRDRRSGAAPAPLAEPAEEMSEAIAGSRAPDGASDRPNGRRRPEPIEDNALYSCGCGFVFAAAVSTSVACPHCGDGQAW